MADDLTKSVCLLHTHNAIMSQTNCPQSISFKLIHRGPSGSIGTAAESVCSFPLIYSIPGITAPLN